MAVNATEMRIESLSYRWQYDRFEIKRQRTYEKRKAVEVFLWSVEGYVLELARKKKGPSKGEKICQRNVVELMLEHKVSGRAWSMVRILMQNSLDPGDKMKLFLCRGYFDRNLSDSQYDPREDIKRIIVVLSAKTRSRLKAMGFFFYTRDKISFCTYTLLHLGLPHLSNGGRRLWQ